MSKCYKKDPPKTTKNNWGCLAIFLSTCDIKEVTAYLINKDY